MHVHNGQYDDCLKCQVVKLEADVAALEAENERLGGALGSLYGTISWVLASYNMDNTAMSTYCYDKLKEAFDDVDPELLR